MFYGAGIIPAVTLAALTDNTATPPTAPCSNPAGLALQTTPQQPHQQQQQQQPGAPVVFATGSTISAINLVRATQKVALATGVVPNTGTGDVLSALSAHDAHGAHAHGMSLDALKTYTRTPRGQYPPFSTPLF